MSPDPFISSALLRTHPPTPAFTAPGPPLGTVALGPERGGERGQLGQPSGGGPARAFLCQLAGRRGSGLSSGRLRARPSPEPMGAVHDGATPGQPGPPGRGKTARAADRRGHTRPWCPFTEANAPLCTWPASCWKSCPRSQARGESVHANGWSSDPATSMVQNPLVQKRNSTHKDS